MTMVKVAGIKRVRAKGRVYHYHRATGERLQAEFGSAAFLLEVEALDRRVAAAKAAQAEEARALGGTWRELVEAYRASPEFTQLAASTRADYDDVLHWLKPLHDMPRSQMDTTFWVEIRNKAFGKRKRRFANYVVQVARRIFNWGRLSGFGAINPLSDIPQIRKQKGARVVNRAWSEHERRTVLAAAKGGVRIGVALGMFAAMREGDAVAFRWAGYRNGVIRFDQRKTDGAVEFPAHEQLRAILDAEFERQRAAAAERRAATVVALADAQPTGCVMLSRTGSGFTESGFRASFFALIRQLTAAGLVEPGLTFHGLRHSAGALLADGGSDPWSIAAMLGHRSLAATQIYTRDANRRKGGQRAVRMLERKQKGAWKTTGTGDGKPLGEALPPPPEKAGKA